ncbi:hypothetical protein [Thiohalobacter thiocyanaticus]|nr:hypothetical protein [Thiohalobacter thiocyanaticus]
MSRIQRPGREPKKPALLTLKEKKAARKAKKHVTDFHSLIVK